MLYLDAATAAKISMYRSDLFQFWNQAVLGHDDPAAMEKIRDRLDHEIPGYLVKLQRDINQALDPSYDPQSDSLRSAIIDFYFPKANIPSEVQIN